MTTTGDADTSRPADRPLEVVALLAEIVALGGLLLDLTPDLDVRQRSFASRRVGLAAAATGASPNAVETPP